MVQKKLKKRSKKSSGQNIEDMNTRVTGIDIRRDYSQYEVPEMESRFREKLKKAGLTPIQVDIMVLRFVYDCSFSEIASDLKIIGTLTALRLFEEASEQLKRVGFDD